METMKFDHIEVVPVSGNKKAAINFRTFAEAEEFVKRYGGEIHEFQRRDGERRWKDCGQEFEPINQVLFYTYENDGTAVYDKDDLPLFDNKENWEGWESEKVQKIKEATLSLKENEMVVFFYDQDSWEVKEKKTMSFNYDTLTKEVGVIDFDFDKYEWDN